MQTQWSSDHATLSRYCSGSESGPRSSWVKARALLSKHRDGQNCAPSLTTWLACCMERAHTGFQQGRASRCRAPCIGALSSGAMGTQNVNRAGKNLQP